MRVPRWWPTRRQSLDAMRLAHLGHRLDKPGYVGVLCTTALGMGCCAPGIFAAFASLVGSVGLGFLVRLDILMPTLYGSLAVTLAGLWRASGGPLDVIGSPTLWSSEPLEERASSTLFICR